MVRGPTLVQGCSSRAAQKSSARTLAWFRQSGRSTLKAFPNFAMDCMHDLSEVFRCMAESTKLPGFSHLQNPGCMEGTRQAMTSELCFEDFTKRTQVPPSSAPIRIPKGYGIGGHTQPRHPLLLQWFDQLPLVWEGGSE